MRDSLIACVERGAQGVQTSAGESPWGLCKRLVLGAVLEQQIQAAGSQGSQGLEGEGSIIGSVITFQRKGCGDRRRHVCLVGSPGRTVK